MKDEIRSVLRSFKNGEIGEAEAERLIDSMSIIRLSHASVDAARERRCGAGEVIYGAGKTPAQIVEIASVLAARGSGVLATRLPPDGMSAFLSAFRRRSAAKSRALHGFPRKLRARKSAAGWR